MRCLSRVTDSSTAQHFADQRHKFYLESRCGRPTLPNTDVCVRCSVKLESCMNQHSRSFLHGKVYELIPPNSHLYGGPWYMEGVKKWGAPSADRVEYAKQFQMEARGEYVVMPQGTTLSANTGYALEKQVKAIDENVVSEMPRAKESDKPRKPKIGKQKPVVGEALSEALPEESQVQEVQPEVQPEVKPVKTRKPRKKPEIGPSALLPLHKEVVLHTHMESTIEEFDTDGFEIEYVRLSTFEHESQMYFRDSKKNKLYKKIKEKTIGSYVGRYDPDTDTIHTDVPDSDCE